jgi:putative endonuclease
MEQMAGHNDLGRLGEALAQQHLIQKGYQILAQNWRHGRAEVDLIAYFQHRVVFIEVKTRSSIAFGRPETFVSNAKQKLLEYAANEYIYLRKHIGEIRFDIVSILFDTPHKYTINHIEDAFWPA